MRHSVSPILADSLVGCIDEAPKAQAEPTRTWISQPGPVRARVVQGTGDPRQLHRASPLPLSLMTHEVRQVPFAATSLRL